MAVYVEIIGCLAGLAVGLRKRKETWAQAWKVLKRTTWASLVIAALTFLLWCIAALLSSLEASLYDVVMLGKLGQLIVFVLALASLGTGLYFLAPLMGEMLPYFKVRFYSVGTCEEWKWQFRGLDPNTQALLLRQMRRKMFDQSDHELLSMLEEVQDSVKAEPALSAYWEKRFEFEQITRQHRIG